MILSVSLYSQETDKKQMTHQEMEKLRSQYKECKKELNIRSIGNILEARSIEETKYKNIKTKNHKMKNYKKLLDKERLKNTLLIVEIDTLKNTSKSNNKYDEILLKKDMEIKKLKKHYTLQEQNNKIEDENPFPSLILKEKLKTEINKSIEIATFSEAFTYRLNKASDIYSDINASNIVDNWEKDTLFTSNIISQNRVKITGYFINDIWGKSKKELWIEKVNTKHK